MGDHGFDPRRSPRRRTLAYGLSLQCLAFLTMVTSGRLPGLQRYLGSRFGGLLNATEVVFMDRKQARQLRFPWIRGRQVLFDKEDTKAVVFSGLKWLLWSWRAELRAPAPTLCRWMWMLKFVHKTQP